MKIKKNIITDIVCNVLANECSTKLIYATLNEFLPNYEKLNLNYTNPPDDEKYEFKSEEEMISYFVDNRLDQTFYWNKYINNPNKIMVGANITNDNKLIISLTFNGTETIRNKFYQKLKLFLNSEIGVITYVNPAEYDNGKDFIFKYQK